MGPKLLEETQFTIRTEDDRGLHCRRWGSVESSLAILVVHGLGEHSGCYEEFGGAMSQQGFAVYAYDQHGHGKSPGKRGQAPSLQFLVDDIQTVHSFIAEEQPNGQIVPLGHSMGGHLVLRLLLHREQADFAQAIVINPMILPKNPPTKAQSFAAWLTAKAMPGIRVSAEIDPRKLTRDTDQLQRLANDPLLHDRLSIGIGGELMSSGYGLIESASEIHSNVLFLAGGQDELCDANTSEQFRDELGSQCTYRCFNDMKHSLLIEKDREEVFHAIQAFLAKERLIWTGSALTLRRDNQAGTTQIKRIGPNP